MATLPLKSSHKEQPSVSRWQKDLAQMPFSRMRPVYCDKYFMRPAMRVWCKTLAHGQEESVVDDEEPSPLLYEHTHPLPWPIVVDRLSCMFIHIITM